MTTPHDWTHPAPPAPDDVLDLPRDIIGPDTKDVYALRVKGYQMIDALINDGDIIIMRRVHTVEQGDMVAVWIKSQELTTLRRYFLWPGKMGMSGRVTLKAENEAYEPLCLDEDDVQIQGKVIAVIRHV
jgi:repressor LexA